MLIIRSILTLIASLMLTACNAAPDPVALNTVKTGTPALWKVSGTKPEQKGVAGMQRRYFPGWRFPPVRRNWTPESSHR